MALFVRSGSRRDQKEAINTREGRQGSVVESWLASKRKRGSIGRPCRLKPAVMTNERGVTNKEGRHHSTRGRESKKRANRGREGKILGGAAKEEASASHCRE